MTFFEPISDSLLEKILIWLRITDASDIVLVGFGLCAQAMFMARFLVQWLKSEKAGYSVVPVAFWYLSIAGGIMLFVYGVLRGELVIILGQSLGIVIYWRNLCLIRRAHAKA